MDLRQMLRRLRGQTTVGTRKPNYLGVKGAPA